MYCRYCGKQIDEDSKFCSFCGKPTGGIQQNTESMSDWIRKAKTGDQTAIAFLYEKTYSQVFYTIKSMIKDEDAVFDILQDSYIKAFTHLEQLNGELKFLPWIRQIAANTARDWLKKKKPMLFVELESDNDQNIPPEELFLDERMGAIPEQVIDQKETARLIREIIEELPEDQRAVIGMFYYEELSVKQIAAAMGVSESAVKSRLMYGRKKIEAKIKKNIAAITQLYQGCAYILITQFLLYLYNTSLISCCILVNGHFCPHLSFLKIFRTPVNIFPRNSS